MVRIKLIVLIFFIINSIAFSQNDTLQLDSCTCKNEISLNVIPIFSEVMVGDVEHQKFNLLYRHKIKNGALRVQVFYIPVYSYYYIHDQLHYSRYDDIEDSTGITRTVYLRDISSVCFGGAIGYEWHKQKKRVERFIGFDVSYGVNYIKHHTKVSEWKQQSSTDGSGSNEFYEYRTVSDSKLETQIMRIGLNPFYGWKIMIEDQFSMAVQFGPDFGYYTGHIATIDNNYELGKKSVSDFYFSKYFLNEVSVIFRF